VFIAFVNRHKATLRQITCATSMLKKTSSDWNRYKNLFWLC